MITAFKILHGMIETEKYFSYQGTQSEALSLLHSSSCLRPGGGVLPLWPNRGGPVSLRVLPIGYQMALFVNHILPIRGILRFEAIYYVSTRYAPPHTNLVITASIINEF